MGSKKCKFMVDFSLGCSSGLLSVAAFWTNLALAHRRMSVGMVLHIPVCHVPQSVAEIMETTS